VQQKRDDGWWYGFVVFNPEEQGKQGDDSLVAQMKAAEAKQKAAAKASKGIVGVKGGQAKKPGISAASAFLSSDSTAEVSLDDALLDLDADDEGGGSGAGWFPASFTRNPQPSELASLQAVLGGTQAAVDVLAPPSNWTTKDDPDPLNANLFEVPRGSAERTAAEDFFKASLGRDNLAKLKGITSLQRVESLSLWQSYVAKRQGILMRGKAEGLSPDAVAEYEQVWMFHG
jgi:hypothetical protein